MKSGVVTLRSFSGSKTVNMFFKLVLLCSVLSCVLAAPAATDVVPLEKQQPTVIPIVSQSEELETNGTYKFSYETGNGIKREEISYEKVVPIARSGGSEEGDSSNESNEIHVQQGSYSYVAPDGTVISVKYIADENGFRPVGDHLPRAPVLVPETESKSNEKAGRALKPRIKEDKSEPEAKTIETPQEAEVKSEEKATLASEPKDTVEKQTPEAPKNDVPQNSEESTASTAAGSVKAKSENASTTEAASSSEAASTTEAATTAVTKNAPVSTTVTDSEAALTTTEAVSTTEAATTAADKTTAVPTTEASAASDAASTTVAQASEAETSPAQANTEASGSTTTKQASSTATL